MKHQLYIDWIDRLTDSWTLVLLNSETFVLHKKAYLQNWFLLHVHQEQVKVTRRATQR